VSPAQNAFLSALHSYADVTLPCRPYPTRLEDAGGVSHNAGGHTSVQSVFFVHTVYIRSLHLFGRAVGPLSITAICAADQLLMCCRSCPRPFAATCTAPRT
jgi:hypothetical protein